MIPPNRLMSQEGFDQQQTKAPDGDQELGLAGRAERRV